jgi:hypothetical protein
MAYASSATPILHPIIRDTYSKLVPAPVTRKPSEQGYTSGFLGAREVATQEQWVRLFYARYFEVTPTELEITFGTSVTFGRQSGVQKKQGIFHPNHCLGVDYESRVATDALEAAGVHDGVIEMAGESLVSHRRTLAVHIYLLCIRSPNKHVYNPNTSLSRSLK